MELWHLVIMVTDADMVCHLILLLLCKCANVIVAGTIVSMSVNTSVSTVHSLVSVSCQCARPVSVCQKVLVMKETRCHALSFVGDVQVFFDCNFSMSKLE